MKLISLMETGMVRGGEALVPHLFQFLVLLASDQSKLVTIPQVKILKLHCHVAVIVIILKYLECNYVLVFFYDATKNT